MCLALVNRHCAVSVRKNGVILAIVCCTRAACFVFHETLNVFCLEWNLLVEARERA
jgi:hypothetical protein